MSSIRTAVRSYIGANRESPVVKALHRAASFVESSWSNEGSDFDSNGEHRVIQLLAPAGFKFALDVGANVGDWLLDAAAAWPGCHIHAFEAAPRTFQTLSDRVAATPCASRATLHNLALSDRDGTQQMFYFPDHPELTCDMPRHSHIALPFEATLATGDSRLAVDQIAVVDFVKIDVEGAEYRVIQGFREALSAGKIHCLQFEYGAFSIQTRFLLADYYALLQQDFWIGKIHTSSVEFSDYDWTMESFQFANYCCVSRTRPDLRSLLSPHA